jgi:hypothetical protein
MIHSDVINLLKKGANGGSKEITRKEKKTINKTGKDSQVHPYLGRTSSAKIPNKLSFLRYFTKKTDCAKSPT